MMWRETLATIRIRVKRGAVQHGTYFSKLSYITENTFRIPPFPAHKKKKPDDSGFFFFRGKDPVALAATAAAGGAAAFLFFLGFCRFGGSLFFFGGFAAATAAVVFLGMLLVAHAFLLAHVCWSAGPFIARPMIKMIYVPPRQSQAPARALKNIFDFNRTRRYSLRLAAAPAAPGGTAIRARSP